MVPAWAAGSFDGPGSNDHHPPAPVMLGQKLVNTVYEALARSPYWDRCLIVVTYDEHGGFFDHLSPPVGCGPRVPTLLVSPHLKRGVCSETFDHASLIKTILLRFGSDTSIDDMPRRVREAQDLSSVIREDNDSIPHTTVPNLPVEAAVTDSDLHARQLPAPGSTLGQTIGFSDDQLTDLQKDIIYGIAIPLRTGFRSYRRLRYWTHFRFLVRLLRKIRKPFRRLKPRRP
jgi:phospholipase C